MGICALCGRKRAMSTVFFESGKADQEFKYKYTVNEGEVIMVHQKCYMKRKDLINRTKVYGNIAILEKGGE